MSDADAAVASDGPTAGQILKHAREAAGRLAHGAS